jgi:hypothetical protein
MKTVVQLPSIMLLAVFALGCEQPKLPASKAPAPVAAAPEPAPIMVAGAPGEPLPPIKIPVTSTPRPVDPDDPIRGRRSKRAGGSLGATAHARFWAEHKIIYDQVKSNLGLYMATEGNLDFPKSNEEFFEKIVKGYQMKLPELEPHHEYVYVPERAEEGLLIRLKPGFNQDGTPIADGASPVEAPPADAAAADTPGESSADPAASTTPEPESGRDEAGNPLDLRERAAGIGGPVLDQ